MKRRSCRNERVPVRIGEGLLVENEQESPAYADYITVRSSYKCCICAWQCDECPLTIRQLTLQNECLSGVEKKL